MDDQDVAHRVGTVALALVLVALTWVLVLPSPGMRGGNDHLRVSGRPLSGGLSAHHQRPLDQLRRCIEAAAGDVTGCVAVSFPPSTPSDRRGQPLSHRGVAGAPRPPTRVPAPSAPAGLPPATLQPSTPQPSTQPSTPQPSSPQPSNPQPSAPPAPARPPSPHNGPVPGGIGGNTS